MRIRLTSWTCVQCGRVWHAAIGTQYDSRCPACRTTGWRRALDEHQACGHVQYRVTEIDESEVGTITHMACLDCDVRWVEVRPC